jgi:hypothetical protein
MALRASIRRPLLVGAAAVAATLLGATPALAHHCYIPMYSLNGPSSPNWEVYSAERGATEFMGFDGCEEAVAAGYAALREEGLPVGIKIKVSMTIGDPKGEGRMNPNGADGKGLEYFGAGSDLADRMLETWYVAASSVDCGGS